MKINWKNRYILLTILLFSANALLIGGALYTAKKIMKNSETLGAVIVKLDKKRLSTVNLRDNLNQIKEVDQKVASYDRLFFTQGQELLLITDLENMATKHGVTQKISSPNLDNYANNRIDIVMNVTGPYISVLKYMHELETYKYLLAIEKIVFQPSGSAVVAGSASEQMAALQLTLSLYAQPNQPTTAEKK